MANPPLFILDTEADSANGRQPPFRTGASLWASAEDTLQDVRSIHTEQSQLQRSTSAMPESLTNGTLNTEDLQAQLQENLRAIGSVPNFGDSVLDSFPWSMKPTPQSAVKVKQVLATPELLEQILIELNTQDIFRAVQINRAACQIFNVSPKLLDRLNLRAHRKGRLHNMLHYTMPGFGVRVDNDAARDEGGPFGDSSGHFHRISITVHFTSEESKLPRISSLCRRMFVAQPLVCRMRASVSCCSRRVKTCGEACCDDQRLPMRTSGAEDWKAPRYLEELSDGDGNIWTMCNQAEHNANVGTTSHIEATDGITVGHLHDATAKLREVHRRCLQPSCIEPSDDGYIRPRISFYGVLVLAHNDPYLFGKEDAKVDVQLRYVSTVGVGSSMTVVSVCEAAKGRASGRGWPVLTFEGFKAKHLVGKFAGLAECREAGEA